MSFWEHHGWLALFGLAVFPRITLFLAFPWGGWLWWTGCMVLPLRGDCVEGRFGLGARDNVGPVDTQSGHAGCVLYRAVSGALRLKYYPCGGPSCAEGGDPRRDTRYLDGCSLTPSA